MTTENTSIDWNDPEHFMKVMLATIGSLTKQAIDNNGATLSEDFDQKLKAIEDRLSFIDNNDLTERLSALDELLKSLDLNQNKKVVDDLLSILNIAKEANITANRAITLSEANKQKYIELIIKYQTSYLN